jgi:hypothetical protein
MAPECTVQEVLFQLRRRHLIADLSRIEHNIIFPAYKFASLSLTDKLKDVGIHDLSVLHIRTSVLGGSPDQGSSESDGESSGQVVSPYLTELLTDRI